MIEKRKEEDMNCLIMLVRVKRTKVWK